MIRLSFVVKKAFLEVLPKFAKSYADKRLLFYPSPSHISEFKHANNPF